ncbi:MAG: IS200/IS605 family element transposase accessory protein TnpB [Acidimicrobiia bacterium]|nr:IS200/IS605 family element transposase accessory protein TnpB [Acidimicrobiia bacterium]
MGNLTQRIQHLLGKTHARAANVRRDVLHKATTRLAQTCDRIVIETLNVDGMGRRKPGAGKGGRASNRSIRDAALAEIGRMLEYKTRWYGSELIRADRWYPSSKLCSDCGNRKPKLPPDKRTYHCEHCGLEADRDHNAAVNLANYELSPESGSGDTKQGRGADRKTQPAQAGNAGGREASTPHQPTLDQTGTVTLKRMTA